MLIRLASKEYVREGLMSVTLYRSGPITPYEDIHNIQSDNFDMYSIASGYGPSGRGSSVYATPSMSEVFDMWFDYRWTQNKKACIFKITISEDVSIPTHLISAYESFVYSPDSSFVEDYMGLMIPLDALDKENEKDYEALIPYDVALRAEWSLIDCEDSLCTHVDGVEIGDTYLGVELLYFVEAQVMAFS